MIYYVYIKSKWVGMTMRQKAIKKSLNAVSFLLVLYDIIMVNLAYLAALWLRFDCNYDSIPLKYLKPAFQIMPLHTIIMLVVLASMRLYQSVWRYASLPELIRILWVSLIGAVTQIAGTLLFLRRMPISYYFMGWMLMFAALAVSRFGYRAMHMIYRGKNKGGHKGLLPAGQYFLPDGLLLPWPRGRPR